jgi:hypothetical protein
VFRCRRHLPLGVAAALLLASAAAAAPSSFTVAWTPSHVKPSSSASYTVTLTNSLSSDPNGADRATISVDSFQVVEQPTASVTGCGSSSSWSAEVAPDGHTITLRRTGPSANNLCPGGTLTVVFTAGSPASEGSYVWPTAVFHGEEAFTGGPSPTVIVDGTPPETAIHAGPPSLTNDQSANFSFSSSEAGMMECRLDGGAFSVCTSPKSYSGIGAGGHVFEVKASDLAGNTDASPASHAWTIETRPPTAAVASGPTAVSASRSATFVFSADEPASFVCRLDGAGFEPCTSPTSYNGLGDGTHGFTVRPTDAVGNVGNAASYVWTIDATPPQTTLASGPRSGRTTSATFRFRASEPVTFECKLDGAAFAQCRSPKSYARLRKSRHSFEVRAIDAAGNIDATPAVHRWTIAAAPRTVKTTSALLTPPAGARVKTPPRLVWRPVVRASYYNVQLYRGGIKVLSAWPRRPRLQLRARWTYLGRRRALSPGAYRWYVWPAYSRNRYGRLLGQSTFTMIAH